MLPTLERGFQLKIRDSSRREDQEKSRRWEKETREKSRFLPFLLSDPSFRSFNPSNLFSTVSAQDASAGQRFFFTVPGSWRGAILFFMHKMATNVILLPEQNRVHPYGILVIVFIQLVI